jgi:predicted cupin superfamily sugar epimerase
MGPTYIGLIRMPRGTKTGSILPRQRHVSKTALWNRQGSQIAPVTIVGGVVLPGFPVEGYELDFTYI